MTILTLFGRYLVWHYTAGLLDCLRLLGNFLWFVYHFFSVPVLGRTLLSPWRRLTEAYRGGFDPGRALETLIVNTLMRLFGLVVRVSFLAVAVLILLITFLLGFLLTAFFLLAPLIIPTSFTIGFYLLFLV